MAWINTDDLECLGWIATGNKEYDDGFRDGVLHVLDTADELATSRAQMHCPVCETSYIMSPAILSRYLRKEEPYGSNESE